VKEDRSVEILSEEGLAERVNFARPLHPSPEERRSIWCIPFEWGNNAKGTKISLSKAKEIASELRALIAQEEANELRRAFEEEKKRCERFGQAAREDQEKRFALEGEIAILKERIRELKKARAK
jgi:hypothetical protein